jgi:DNA-binding transcriptional LysR family regulator
MNVTLNQLRAFERIVRLGSFHRAAQDLHLTQPSVSQRIRELESALGTPLFMRVGPRITPTAEAHALLSYADRMLEMAGEMSERFRSRDPLRGTLRIGVSENFAMVCLTEMFRRLEQRYPAITASVFIGDSGQLSQRLNQRELDIAIVAEPAVAEHVEQVNVGVSRVAWFASADYPLPRGPVTAQQLAQHHLMIAPPSARQHATVTRWFAQAQAQPARVSTCNNAAITRLAILGGTAIGLMAARIMQPDLETGAVKMVAVRPPRAAHRMALCYQRSEAGPALQAFIALMRELIAQFHVFDANGLPSASMA